MKPNILIITANFYEDISSDLSAGAIVEVKAKAKFKKIVVPGVFEIPVIIAKIRCIHCTWVCCQGKNTSF